MDFFCYIIVFTVWLHIPGNVLIGSIYYATCISKMIDGLEVITEQLSNSEQPHWYFQMLPDTPTKTECNAMWSQMPQENFPGSSERFRSFGTEYKNIRKIL